ncbi:DUF3817 domain-containing protein [Taibaiella koreensis]|uniref:DUF3817 domain-containing protein n=1 Tax=Taibaiella koreensis TaxID=1268548 RepID=UPI000E59DA90|nr:DUF3817 domain-containing protein [Taibaiella koreensis]
MLHLFETKTGRLRLIGFFEGLSLLALLFIALPLKYGFGDARLTQALGPVHGVLFLLFVFNTLSLGVEQGWRFRSLTWKVLLACVIPFGTFYIDQKILRRL